MCSIDVLWLYLSLIFQFPGMLSDRYTKLITINWSCYECKWSSAPRYLCCALCYELFVKWNLWVFTSNWYLHISVFFMKLEMSNHSAYHVYSAMLLLNIYGNLYKLKYNYPQQKSRRLPIKTRWFQIYY